MDKIILIAIFWFSFTIKGYTQSNEKDIIITTVEIVAKGKLESYSTFHRDNDSSNYFVRLSIINAEDTTISFYMMNCSWEENWISDNSEISLYYPGCDANFLINVKLKPKEIIAFYGVIRSKHKDIINKKFRLGFKLINHKGVSDWNWEKELINTKKIYWSNESELENPIYHFKINGRGKFNSELN